MKQDQPVVFERKVFRSIRPALPLFVVALVVFVSTSKAVLGQNKQQLCQNNKAQLAELEKRSNTLQNEQSYTNASEDRARKFLSVLNKAIVDPQTADSRKFIRSFLDSPAQRQLAVENWGMGLSWKNEFLDDDGHDGLLPLLRALRDAAIRRVERIKYVLTHKAEIQQQKANIDQQIIYHSDRVSELGCGGTDSCNASDRAIWAKISGTWQASYGDVTFIGGCANVSGYWNQGAYSAPLKHDGTDNRGEIKGGEVRRGVLTFHYSQSWNNKKGSDTCSLSSDGKQLSCGYLETLSR